MQTVELNHLNHGDIVCVVWPPNDEGVYVTITGRWSHYTQSDAESGKNETHIILNDTMTIERNITSGDHITMEPDSVLEATIYEDEYNDMRYYLIEPTGWKAAV
jgi:hypothetical protein